MDQANSLVANPSTEALNNQQPSSTSASIAGASSGTLLVLLASNLPDNYPLKSWLVIIAPTVSIAFSLIWKFLIREKNAYYKRKRVVKFKKLLLQKIEAALSDGLISSEEAAALKRKMIEIELQSIDNLANKIKTIEFEE
ncbi:MAG: hypothetical protein H6Q26_2207 [Bacteroidetes bacterium]|uniref:hypothetical protein n=1 Tax=unclassified Chitinophaga TaxID=2619133 RepID=UPI0009CCCA8B|nr:MULTISPECIES: hypothetical protein [unclassified Chitinophaga]MBP1652050.1 hypothetical protein [Bacteroidota bacterium]OMP80618.1 hypothetical protein BW716_03705 [[Flexibacter] sp. ATCC 35208]WPV69472.1 hypothetical protein QQL36_12235 [Chitinophaga sp. LS1]